MKSKISFEDSKFIKELYPTKEATPQTLAFAKMNLVQPEILRTYCSNKTFFTKEHIDLLVALFGKTDTTSGFIEVLPLCVNTTGKDAQPRDFYFMSHTSRGKFITPSVINFIYYESGTFHCIQPSTFIGSIKSTTFSRVDRTHDVKMLEELHKLFDKSGITEEQRKFLLSLNLKSNKTTLSKILISLFPEIMTNLMIELGDFIQSEMLSTQSDDRISKDIFELSGDLITYFYNIKNYMCNEEGTLGASCMRSNSNTEQIKFYANNPDAVALLSFIEKKKLLARAVLWKGVDGKKYVDRIYCSSSKYGIRLAAYCKAKKYSCVHRSTVSEYGLEYSSCVVKLNTFETTTNMYPYFDSMTHMDIIGKYFTSDRGYLAKYLDEIKASYLIKHVNRSDYGYEEMRDLQFKQNGSTRLKYIKDARGGDVANNLWQYTLINKPRLAITLKSDSITINDDERVDGKWCENVLIKKYNSLRPTLVESESNTKIIKYVDKQYVVYSSYHRMYILIKDAVFLNSLGTNVLKSVLGSVELTEVIRLKRLRKTYSNKLVKLTEEGFNSIKEQIRLLPFHETLMDIRKSRIYMVTAKNIRNEGIKIKGLIIPFKHLKLVNNERKGENQK